MDDFCCSFQSRRARCAGSLTYLSLPRYYLRLRTAYIFRIRGFWGGDSLFWEETHFQGGKSERTGPPPADGSDIKARGRHHRPAFMLADTVLSADLVGARRVPQTLTHIEQKMALILPSLAWGGRCRGAPSF